MSHANHAARASTLADLTRPLALGLLLLALALRAVIPVGYMPDAQALRQGMWRLGFCAVDPAVPVGLDGHRGGAGSAASTTSTTSTASAASTTSTTSTTSVAGPRHAGAAPHNDAAHAAAPHHRSGAHGQSGLALHSGQSPQDPRAPSRHTAHVSGAAPLSGASPSSGAAPAHALHDADPHQQAQGIDCPFYVAAHLALHLPGGAAFARIAPRQLFNVFPRAQATVPASRIAGPPLGPRAPPRASA